MEHWDGMEGWLSSNAAGDAAMWWHGMFMLLLHVLGPIRSLQQPELGFCIVRVRWCTSAATALPWLVSSGWAVPFCTLLRQG